MESGTQKICLPFSFYKFLIPILNSIVYKLLDFKTIKCSFLPTYSISRNYPRYINVPDENTQECSLLREGPICLTPELYQHHQSSYPLSTLTQRMKNGFCTTLRALSTCDVNPNLVNATTVSAYRNICDLLRIQMISPANFEQCLSCREGLSSCRCYCFKFNCLQRISCDCFGSRLGMCSCDVYPEIFLDIDQLRNYQEYVIRQFIESNLACLPITDHTTYSMGFGWKMEIKIFQSDAGLRRHTSRCLRIRVSEYLPP